MSIADHFHHAPDAAFVRNYDGESARRQFRISIILVAVIAAAAAAMSAVVRFDAPNPTLTPVVSSIATPSYAGKL